ncbi:alpha/beta hydrolase [Saccharibacillus kuerlensis]|uniref:Alpha/beta hydrolase n=1 Tax=Saccharibacillus kuerlensis TaxID=459527 RepID=A0ABQ2LB38_9BACL|nr:alpha/beta hydrolase [Saccharibacillus kuerlensis]GGO07985.1 alpha/beta hydrolase [Saccharibacillus kuerlensis]
MENMTATRFFNEVLSRREEKGVEEAYLFVREHGDCSDARQMNMRYALAAASGRTDEAFDLLNEAVVECGFWYPAEYLLEDEDLETLREREGFAELADLCARREEAAYANAAPGLTVLQPEISMAQSGTGAESAVRPLLLVLHGDQESQRDAEPFWKPALQYGWTVGLIRSSQIRFANAYGWDDIDLGAAELREHLESLTAAEDGTLYGPIVLGAFSAGAEVALNALLHDEFPADGLILTAPWLAEPEEWTEALERLEERTPRVVVLVGEEDHESSDSSEQLTRSMQLAGLECRLSIIPGVGHDYPEDFASRLIESLAWFAEDGRV